LVRRPFAEPVLDIIYCLKERRPVVEVTEEINVCIGAHDCTADDTARRSNSSKGSNAIDGNRRPTKHLAIDDDGEGANDAAGNLGKGEVRWMDGWMDGWTSWTSRTYMKADKV